MFMTNACLFILRDYGDVSYFLVYIIGMHINISKLLLSQNDSSVRMVISQHKWKVWNDFQRSLWTLSKELHVCLCMNLNMVLNRHVRRFFKNFLHTHFFLYFILFFPSPFIPPLPPLRISLPPPSILSPSSSAVTMWLSMSMTFSFFIFCSIPPSL